MITPDNANYDSSGIGCTSEVGTYPANPWGLYDMHGNVLEWVEDDWHRNYRGAPTDGSAWKDMREGRDAHLGVLRGGSWINASRFCRSAVRSGDRTRHRINIFGFRVARTLS